MRVLPPWHGEQILRPSQIVGHRHMRREWEAAFARMRPLNEGERLRAAVQLIRLRRPTNRIKAILIHAVYPTAWSSRVLGDRPRLAYFIAHCVPLTVLVWLLTMAFLGA